MKTIIALIIKFSVLLAAAWVCFMVIGTAVAWTVLMIAATGTVINYLIGDLFILPRFGNIIASVIDGILGGAIAWMVLAYLPVTYSYQMTVYLFAIVVSACEFFFHLYLFSAHVVERKKTDEDFYRKQKLNYRTETGGEIYPYISRDSNERNDRQGTLNSGYNKSVDLTDHSDEKRDQDKPD